MTISAYLVSVLLLVESQGALKRGHGGHRAVSRRPAFITCTVAVLAALLAPAPSLAANLGANGCDQPVHDSLRVLVFTIAILRRPAAICVGGSR